MISFDFFTNLPIPRNLTLGTGLLLVGGGLLCGVHARLTILEWRQRESLFKENLELTSSVSDLESKLDAALKEKESVIKNNRILSKDYHNCTEKIQNQTVLQKELVFENEKLKCELIQKENEALENKRSLDILQAKMENVVKTLSNHIQNLEKEVEFLKIQNNDTIHKQKTTEELLKTCQEDIQNKNVELEQRISQITQLENDLTSRDSELFDAKLSLGSLSVVVSIKTEENEHLLNTISSQEADMENMSSYIVELDNQIEFLQAQNSKLTETQRSMEEIIEAHEEDIRIKNDTIHQRNSIIENLKSEVSLKTQELFETSSSLHAKEVALSLLEIENSNMMEKITNEVVRKFKH